LTVLEHLTPADVARAVESHPRLARAVRDIAQQTRLPEDMIRSHLGEALAETLERLGESYVKEMGDTITAVDQLRDQVHQFYDRVLSGQDPNPDTARLSGLFTQLHEKLLELTDPQAWARRRAEAADLLRVMTEEQRRGTATHEQPIGGEGTATEDLSPVERSEGTGRLPRSEGGWDSEPGNSPWVSFNPEVTRITGGEPVEYVHGEPVLRPYAREQVVLARMTGFDSPDFAAARQGLMRQHPGRWRNASHVEAWEHGGTPDLWGNSLGERYTWHHEPDVETMSLVPTALHSNLPHTGGASAARGGARPTRVPPFSTNPL
jgi:hypothetical protein